MKANNETIFGNSDLQIALLKARATRLLLHAAGAGDDYFQIPVSLGPDERADSIRDWIKSFAFDALDEALAEAEAARRRVERQLQIFPRPANGLSARRM